MACFHKFYKHVDHFQDEFGLLPKWNVDTLIIGTFNPDNIFHPNNTALYFYGRKKNYFWKILPVFINNNLISIENPQNQIEFLKKYKIGLTDLLIEVRDADLNNNDHISRIKTVLDSKLEGFNELIWNTNYIKKYILDKNVKSVYFSLLGKNSKVNFAQNTFEFQMRDIEKFCKVNKIKSTRLFTPSGQGLGKGKPRKNKLINQWYNKQLEEDNLFPFINSNFDISNYEYQN